MNASALRAMTVLLLASLLLGDGRVLAAPEVAPVGPRQTAPSTLRFFTRLAVALRRVEKKLTVVARRVKRSVVRLSPTHADPRVHVFVRIAHLHLPPPALELA
ncbi:MAG: hypothetical protein QM770_05185 [Tepidisphaeraceae bacterium]